MEKAKLVLADVVIFGLIALVGALFGFSNTGGVALITGRAVCFVATVLVALSLVVKRPPGSSL
jgi:uncharacterized membrane protein YtjA (UPF0391 family)